MKILVTGATGFVGSHSAAALLRAGHSVRFLARNPTALRQHFARWSLAADDVVQADMQDAAAVRTALQGCDGVLHAAASVNLDPAQAAATYRSNLAGVQHVLGAACTLGLPRMVYVSSLSVLFTPDLPRLDENSPLAASRNAYTQSKTAAERLVRQWQAAGQPIQTTYPAAIIGPDDPKLCASNDGLRTFASKTLPITRTGFQLVDVRDLAAVHLRLLEQEPAEPAERYVVGGHYLPWRDLAAALQRVLGRKPPTLALPAPVFRGLAALADAAQRVYPFNTQLTGEAVAFMTRWSPADSSRVMAHTGRSFRPAESTLTDTLHWMVQAGHLPSDFFTSP
jgi:nucleoside-diphosphate-sugar epimerase